MVHGGYDRQETDSSKEDYWYSAAIGPLLIIIAGSCWGTAGIFVRLFNEWGMFALQIATVRTIVSAIIFALLIFITDRNLFKIKLKDIWCFIGTGCLGTALYNFCYYKTIALSSLSVAATLLYTSPIFVAIFSVLLFGEKMTVRKLVALALAFGGCLMVSGVLNSGAEGLTGKAFAIGILSGMSYAFLYNIFQVCGDVRLYRLYNHILHFCLGSYSLCPFS